MTPETHKKKQDNIDITTIIGKQQRVIGQGQRCNDRSQNSATIRIGPTVTSNRRSEMKNQFKLGLLRASRIHWESTENPFFSC